jgi:adenylate cyclase
MLAVDDQIQQVEQAIAVQEVIRPTVGDALVEPALGALRAQLTALHARRPGCALAEWTERRLAPAAAPGYGPASPPMGWPANLSTGNDRKRVTVLFADLADFTALGERHPAEVIRALQTDLFEQMATVIDEYEGYVEKFIGDAMMAVFGAPLPHRDHPECALRAALALRASMAALNARWAARLGQPLALHVGVNSGLVVAGYLGTTLGGAYMVTGDAVNTAARLQDLARPGQILVGRDTFEAARSGFKLVPLAPIAVKGKQEPVVAYELRGAR